MLHGSRSGEGSPSGTADKEAGVGCGVTSIWGVGGGEEDMSGGETEGGGVLGPTSGAVGSARDAVGRGKGPYCSGSSSSGSPW